MLTSNKGFEEWGEIFGDDVDSIREVLHAAKTNSVTREIQFTGPGRPVHAALTATELTAGGFVLVIEDLTEVVRAQKATAWREVARRLAHEIKNPLTPIQLSAERIGRNIVRLPAAPPRVTTVIEECVQAIVQEEAFESLDAPVRILGALDTPVPYSPPLEEYFLPSEESVERAARLLLAY